MTAKARSKPAPQELQFQIARFLIGTIFALLPLVVSITGLDKFRTPKDIAASIAIILLAVLCLANSSFRIRLGAFECTVLVATAYVLVHSFFWGSLEAAVTVCLFALWLLLLPGLMSWEFQKRVWLIAGLCLSLNSVVNIFQYLGRFPWMLQKAGEVISGRLTPAGFLGEVGSGALLFGLIVLVSLYFLLLEEKKGLRMTWLLICVCNLTGLIFTRSVTASLALGGCLVLWVCFHHWWVFKRSPGWRRRLPVFWIVLLLAVGGSAAVASQSRLWNRIGEVTRDLLRGNLELATAGRYSVFLITWDMIKDRPLTGHGLDSFAPAFYRQRTETEYGRGVFLLPQPGAFQEAHNEYLHTWAELGLPGLLLLLGLMGSSLFLAASRALREQDAGKSYWLGILSLCLVYFGISSLTIFPLHITLTALFLTMIAGSVRHLDLYGFGEKGTVKAGKPRGPLVLLALLVALPVLYRQYQKWQANNDLGRAAFLLEQANQHDFNARQRRAVVIRALKLVESTESSYSGFPELHNLRGSAAMILGRYELAESSYKKAIETIPSPETMTNLAAALIAQRECEKATAYLESALNYNSSYPKARRARRHCREQGG